LANSPSMVWHTSSSDSLISFALRTKCGNRCPCYTLPYMPAAVFMKMPFALKSRGYLHFLCVPAPCASLSSPSNIGIPAGGSVTIQGLSFGGVTVTPTASLAAGEICSSTAWTSATTATCAPAAYKGTIVRTAVSVSALAGTVTGQFSFDGALHFAPLHAARIYAASALYVIQRRS
jgi:hypothetical protein